MITRSASRCPKNLPEARGAAAIEDTGHYKPAVAHAIFPPLATHLCKTTFKYIDNVEHEATLMCCLLGGHGRRQELRADAYQHDYGGYQTAGP